MAMLDDQRPFYLRMIEAIVRLTFGGAVRCSLLPFRKSEHEIIRYAMYARLKTCFDKLQWPQSGVQALSISGSQYLTKLACDRADIIDAAYPDHNMLNLSFPDESFDLVVSDQVLEHVEGDPFKAVAESLRVLRPGGIAVHATVLLFQIHGYPSDYWRFTPDGLQLLCQGFDEIIDSGGWGNRYLWFLSWLGVVHGFNVPVASWHPYTRCASFNEARYPVVTWIVARKK